MATAEFLMPPKSKSAVHWLLILPLWDEGRYVVVVQNMACLRMHEPILTKPNMNGFGSSSVVL